MRVSRRLFIRDGVATVTLGLAAPAFLTAIAEAQGLGSRRLVVVYLGGGNDALSTLVPYQDPSYYSRRPTIAIPAGQVLQVGTDAGGRALGLHPRLGGLRNIFNEEYHNQLIAEGRIRLSYRATMAALSKLRTAEQISAARGKRVRIRVGELPPPGPEDPTRDLDHSRTLVFDEEATRFADDQPTELIEDQPTETAIDPVLPSATWEER